MSERTKLASRTKQVAISSLTPYPGNPRRGDVAQIKASLEAHGQYRPIVVQEATSRVLAGNHTMQAAIELGWTKMLATVIDVDDEQAKKIVVVDNRSNDLAENDDASLADMLVELPDLDGTGYSQDDLDELLKGLERALEDKIGTDTEPIEPPAVPKTKLGDLYVMGEHRLLCGDSSDSDNLKRVGIEPTAACITDPPYGIGFEYGQHDDSSNEANLALVQAVLGIAPPLRVWTPGKMNLGRELAWNSDAKVICWHKGFAQAGNGMGGASTWEPVIVVGSTSNARIKNDYINVGTDRDPFLIGEGGLKHPCPKPVELYETLIAGFTEDGGMVYEPFCGSGTTLIACENIRRRCMAIELDPAYCDVIVDRWERHIGQKAVLQDG